MKKNLSNYHPTDGMVTCDDDGDMLSIDLATILACISSPSMVGVVVVFEFL